MDFTQRDVSLQRSCRRKVGFAKKAVQVKAAPREVALAFGFGP